MIEGDMYPELRHIKLVPYKMELHKPAIPDWTRDDAFDAWRHAAAQVDVVEAVQITMPKDDFDRLMSIYTAHYHAASHHPTVRAAWQQYKMTVALTQGY